MPQYLPEPIETYPGSWSYTPCDKHIIKAYEAAVAQQNKDPELTAKYNALVGALRYPEESRPDISYVTGMLSRCLTYPTETMYNYALRTLVYLGRTADYAIHYSKDTIDADKLVISCDSDWSNRRSTGGYSCKVAGGTVKHRSRRQACIAMSSTESELMELGNAALDVLPLVDVMQHCGIEFEHSTPVTFILSKPHSHKLCHQALAAFDKGVDEKLHSPVEVKTDNKGAYDLCHREGPGTNTRHVERKYFKMRELRGSGLVRVSLVPTETNEADIFTKPLDRIPFERCRDAIMNRVAGYGLARSKTV